MNEKLTKQIQDLVIASFNEIAKQVSASELELIQLSKNVAEESERLSVLTREKESLDAYIEKNTAKLEADNKESINLRTSAENKISELKNLKEVTDGELKVAKDKLEELSAEIKNLDSARRLRHEAELIESNERIQELKRELERRIPELDKKEKDLKNKEADIKTIEARWKKLFGDKGLGFKI